MNNIKDKWKGKLGHGKCLNLLFKSDIDENQTPMATREMSEKGNRLVCYCNAVPDFTY